MEEVVLVEGFHAVKHALRFHAEINNIFVLPNSPWYSMAQNLAPDIISELEKRITVIDEPVFRQHFKAVHPTGIAATAKRPHNSMSLSVNSNRKTPAILLEDPRRLGNVGAAIRVAAAASASGVITTGPADPWSPDAIRASAGLHFALPVERIDSIDQLEGPLIAMDPTGTSIYSASIPANAILAFGTEREGLSTELIQCANEVVSLPMREGISSLNLATSVAATLYVIAQ